MSAYDFKAISKDGKPVTGTIEADNKDLAQDKLASQGYRILSLKPARSGFDPNNIRIPGLQRDRVKTKELVVFTRQLSTMVNAGIALVSALNTLRDQTDNIYFKGIIQQVARDIEGGMPLGDALAKQPKVFSLVYVNMVRAGEAGGILDDILKKLAYQQEKDASIKKKLRSAMAYPTVLLVITTIAFFVLTIFILPGIGKIIVNLAGEDTQLPIYTRAMLAASSFMRHYWFVGIGGIAAGLYAGRKYVATDQGRLKFDRFLLKIPVLKKIIVKVALARFARIFASLTSAGVSVLETIEVTARAIGNKVIENELLDASKAVTNGKQLSEPLSNSKIFPPIVAQMMAVGEETGETETVLVKVADFYEEEVDTLVSTLSSVLEPLMIVVMGSMVGLIAASVMGPIASLSQNIGG